MLDMIVRFRGLNDDRRIYKTTIFILGIPHENVPIKDEESVVGGYELEFLECFCCVFLPFTNLFLPWTSNLCTLSSFTTVV